MKGAIACYIEAVRALRDAGVRLKGDVMIAAVAGEIEKTQWGEYGGRQYRGYGTGSAYLVTHGGIADVCILGEPTEQRIVPAHFGAVWMRISTRGPFVHTAFSEGRRSENSIVRMRDVLDAVLEWAPVCEERMSYGATPGIINIGSIDGGFPWRASRTPSRTDLFLDVRIPPLLELPAACNELATFARGLRERFPDYGIEWEFYVTVPGAVIADDHPLLTALEESHEDVFGSRPEREVLRWTADSSVLVAHGIQTVNYGVSSGLPSAERGENLSIPALTDTAKVYALSAARVCLID
jgi:acetylornithine deacetylase/succinyl-diaminopimelate desuccinylase-like protein